jgi:hypothetical protein
MDKALSTIFPYVVVIMFVLILAHWGILIRLFLLKYKKKKIPRWMSTYQIIMKIGR